MIEQLDTGYASLKDERDVTTVHGVAIGEGDITNGGSGKETLWPRETLEDAAEDLEGAKLATDMDHTADDPNPQTPVEAIIGEVSWAGYKPGVGVLYEAELGDEDIAEKVENGWLEVSPLVSREVEPLEEDKADFKATKINGWRDLATVAKGAAPSNEIQIGEQTLKAEALSQTVHESMASAHESDPGEETPGTHEALKEVAGVSFTGTATGTLDESEIPTDDFEGHYLYPGENKSESSYPVVDADGNLRKGNVDSAWQLGARGDADADTHDSRLMDLANEFENPPEWANNDEAMSGAQMKDPALWEACSVSLPESITVNDDGANGGMSQSSADDDDSKTMTEEDTLTDDEKAVLSAAEDIEDPTEALQSFATMEDPEIVEADDYESLREQVDTAKDLYADALSERWETDKDKIKESFGLEALREEFEDDDGELDTEALVQNPEAGEPEADESGVEALSDDADKDKAEALYADYQTFGNDRLKEDITEALGVSDFETAEEVLN